jgi:hypothetical protein
VSELLNFLKARLVQLENRLEMIPRYIERSGNFLGRNHCSLDDLPIIEDQIGETKAAIKAVKQWNKEKTTREKIARLVKKNQKKPPTHANKR